MTSPDTDAFERAFVATSYLLGNKDALSGLAQAGNGAEQLAQRLAAPERAERARRLSEELAPLVAALGARGIS